MIKSVFKSILAKPYRLLIRIQNKLSKSIRNTAFKIFRKLPVKNNKIFVSSFLEKQYTDSPRAITEELLGRNVNNIKTVWVTEHKIPEIPSKIKQVKSRSLSAMYHQLTSHIWIDSHLKPFGTYKRDEQVYIQTFHGCIALKKVDADAADKFPKSHIERTRYNGRIIDYYISNSKTCDNMYRSGLLYDGKILNFGCPKNDIFFKDNTQLISSIKSKYNIPDDAKIALYAPTFRNGENLKPYAVDYQRLKNALGSKFKGEWYVGVRLHPIVNKLQSKLDLPDWVINFTDYQCMQELLTAADVLITDYSSCMFEFSLQRKPVFLYASDYKDYLSERGLYFDYFKLPFLIGLDNDGLIDAVNGFDNDKYTSDLNGFFNSIGLCDDGNASKRVVDFILNDIIK